MRKLFVVLAVAAFVVAFAMPSMAAEDETQVSIGGFVAMETFWMSEDGEMVDNDGDGEFDDGRFTDSGLYGDNEGWDLDDVTSRINFTFKRQDFKGFVEMRPLANVSFRHWYSEWNFGVGSLVVGQTWVPAFNPISGTIGPNNGGVSGDFGDTGPAAARKPMLALKFPFEIGSVMLGFMRPATGDVAGLVSDDIDVSIPNIEAKVKLAFGPVSFTAFGGINKYKVVEQDAADDFAETSWSVSSHVIGANAGVTFGPAWLKVAGLTGKNLVEYGWYGGEAAVGAEIFDTDADGDLDAMADTDADGFFVCAGFKFTDMISIEAGYGEMDFEMDDVGIDDNDENDNECSMWYVNLPIKVAKGFTITPEIGVYDYEDEIVDNVHRDNGDRTYYGLRWQINF